MIKFRRPSVRPSVRVTSSLSVCISSVHLLVVKIVIGLDLYEAIKTMKTNDVPEFVNSEWLQFAKFLLITLSKELKYMI